MQSRLIYATKNAETLIERCGRVCYGSHDKTTETSAIPFIRGLRSAGHYSVIEHARFVLEIEGGDAAETMLAMLDASPLLRFTARAKDRFLVSGNARMWRHAYNALDPKIDNLLAEAVPSLFDGISTYGTIKPSNPQPHQTIGSRAFVDLWNIDKPDRLTRDELLRHGAATVFLRDVSRSLTHQLVRHRMASYSQQSQRYVKADPDSFGFVTPPSIENAEWPADIEFGDFMYNTVLGYYTGLTGDGIKAEDARYILPNATATEIAVTMTFEHWQNFLGLRCDSHAQWEIRRVADEIKGLLVEHVPEVFA